MKKLTVMLLVMTLVFGLAACGNASEKRQHCDGNAGTVCGRYRGW